MKLNNTMRDEFISAVMTRCRKNCIEKQSYSVTCDMLSRLLLDKLPKEITRVLRDFPESILMSSSYVGWLEGHSPCGRNWLNGRVQHVNGFGINWLLNDLHIDISEIKAGYAAWYREQRALEGVKAKLREQVYGMATTNQLAVVLPDLVDLIPKDSPKQRTALVANNGIISELKAVGLKLPVTK